MVQATTTIVLMATIVLLLLTTPTSASSTHAVNKWKAPNPNTPSEQATAWKEEDEALHAYIASSVPDVLEHTGSEAFDAHLHGVQAILRYWSAPKYLYNAGLFHSICEYLEDHDSTIEKCVLILFI